MQTGHRKARPDQHRTGHDDVAAPRRFEPRGVVQPVPLGLADLGADPDRVGTIGIRAGEQRRLARSGYQVKTLIAYGAAWYRWYMRRLAERPANVLFALRQLLPG